MATAAAAAAAAACTMMLSRRRQSTVYPRRVRGREVARWRGAGENGRRTRVVQARRRVTAPALGRVRRRRLASGVQRGYGGQVDGVSCGAPLGGGAWLEAVLLLLSSLRTNPDCYPSFLEGAPPVVQGGRGASRRSSGSTLRARVARSTDNIAPVELQS